MNSRPDAKYRNARNWLKHVLVNTRDEYLACMWQNSNYYTHRHTSTHISSNILWGPQIYYILKVNILINVSCMLKNIVIKLEVNLEHNKRR
jgi:hypothetical protein